VGVEGAGHLDEGDAEFVGRHLFWHTLRAGAGGWVLGAGVVCRAWDGLCAIEWAGGVWGVKVKYESRNQLRKIAVQLGLFGYGCLV
jgi:hypothetical protein